MSKKFIIMMVTAPNLKVARKIVTALLENRVAACVNVIPHIESHYRWQSKIESAREILLVIKTTERKVAHATHVIQRLHPYEVPEIITLSIKDGLPAYLRWLSESLQPTV